MNDLSIYDTIERMTALIRAEERKKCAEHGLQSVHLQVLDYLSLCNKYSDTPAALANYLGMTRGTVSQTLLLLAGKGFVDKQTDGKDRRVVHLSLTAKAREILAEVRLTGLFAKAQGLLPKEDQVRDAEILVKILTSLQKANQSYSFGICKTCKYFTSASDHHICGLTKETLSDSDSEKICQEHAAC